MLSQLGQIAMPVADVEQSVVYYRDTLGVPFLFQFPGLAFFDCGGVRLMLSKVENDAKPGVGSVLYFQVSDINAECEALRARGVVFEQDPHVVARMPDHELWMAFFRDPDHNLLALMSEVRP